MYVVFVFVFVIVLCVLAGDDESVAALYKGGRRGPAALVYLVGSPVLPSPISENRAERVFTPQNSQAFADREKYDAVFNQGDADSNSTTAIVLIMTAKEGTDVNLLTQSYMLRLFDFQNEMVGTTFGGSTFQNLCAVSAGSGLCTTVSPLDWFNLDRTRVTSDQAVRDAVSTPGAFGPLGNPLTVNDAFGGLIKAEVDSNGPYTQATAVRFTYVLNEGATDESAQPATDYVAAFIKDAPTTLFDKYPEFQIERFHSQSIDEELDRSINDDIALFAGAIVLMSVYVTLVMSDLDQVRTQWLLANTGILSAGMGILTAFGLGGYFQIPFVSTVGVVPFLILGLGVDDMFILWHAYLREVHLDEGEEDDRTDKKEADTRSLEDKVAASVGSSAVSITMTSITDFLAFATAVISDFPAIRYFGLYAMLAVLFDYLYQISFFLSVLGLDARRIEASRSGCLPCIVVPEDGKCRRKKKKAVWISHFFDKYYAPVLLHNIVRGVVLFAFAALLGFGIWGVTTLSEGLDLRDLAPKDSYVPPYLTAQDELFLDSDVGSCVTGATLEGNTYQSIAGQLKYKELQQAVLNIAATKDTLVSSWYDSLTAYVVRTRGASVLTSEGVVPPAVFMGDLLAFLNTREGDRFTDEVLLSSTDASTASVTAARFRYQHIKTPSGSKEQGEQLVALREAIAGVVSDAYVYAGMYVFYEQYVIILDQTLLNMGTALAAVSLVTFIMLVHPGAALLTMLVVAVIDVEVLGFMSFWDVRLDSVSMINLVLVVGIAVDAIAHIVHDFMAATGTRKERATRALVHMGASVFSGSMSTFLGIIVLVFSNSNIFTVFFKVLFLTIVLGLAHGMILLPVLLSFVGPASANTQDQIVPTNNNKKNDDTIKSFSGSYSTHGSRSGSQSSSNSHDSASTSKSGTGSPGDSSRYEETPTVSDQV